MIWTLSPGLQPFNRGRPGPRRRHSVPGANEPYILHSAPCTLHPTPYTLHPTPYALHPATCTLHPTPYTLHLTPCTLHPNTCTPTLQPRALRPTLQRPSSRDMPSPTQQFMCLAITFEEGGASFEGGRVAPRLAPTLPRSYENTHPPGPP